MNHLFKLGVYVAAGVGTYELLRRTGYLEKVSTWLEGQIPEDVKQRAVSLRDQARQHAEDLANQAQDAVRRATGQGNPTAQGGSSDGSGNGNGHSYGQTLTGGGQGVPVTTDDYSGAHVPHKVGRGVIS